MNSSNKTFRDLAICGGKARFSESLHVNAPNFGDKMFFFNKVDSIFNSRQFTNNGPFVQNLEKKLANYLGVAHCVLINNGTTALSLLIQALDLEGEIIIPSFSFISTAHTLMQLKIKPIFCDINKHSWNLDPDHCKSLITPNTSAIIGTHLWGRSCEIERLKNIANGHNLKLIFDAAHAFGCSHNRKLIGGFGNAEVFSFHATKVFHTFEGGAITTNDAFLADRLRIMRNFGFVGYDEVESLGTNAKMTEVCAAAGLTNLRSIESIFRRNKNIYENYKQGLANITGLRLIEYAENSQNNYQYIVLEVNETVSGLTRDETVTILHKENVIARKYFYPGIHKMEPYNSLYSEIDFHLPNTNLIAHRVLLLPGGITITDDQIFDICSILKMILNNATNLLPYLSIKEKKSSDFNLKIRKKRQEACKNICNKQPTVEIRIPISANEKFLRMVHYFLESIQEFGGPISRTAKCVFSVSRDEPLRDLMKECPWAANYNVEFHWLDQKLFDRYFYDATGFHRLAIESEADIVILADADLLISNDFDAIIMEAYQTQSLLGFIAHVSPFHATKPKEIPNHILWSRIFKEANLTLPRFKQVHTGWGLLSTDNDQRSCPDYYNYGFIIAPRKDFEKMASTFVADFDAVDKVVNNIYKSQIANTLSCVRHKISCGTCSINYNFPLNVPGHKIRLLNPDINKENDADDVKIFHYIGHSEIFSTIKTLEDALQLKEICPFRKVFQQKLQIIHDRIKAKYKINQNLQNNPHI